MTDLKFPLEGNFTNTHQPKDPHPPSPIPQDRENYPIPALLRRRPPASGRGVGGGGGVGGWVGEGWGKANVEMASVRPLVFYF